MAQSQWKIAAPVTCAAVICGAAIFWRVHQGKQLADEASVYRVAAERGDAQAQFKLGSAYYHGKGSPHDLAEAARWYRKAAVQGYSKAQHNLAFLYSQGQGVPQSYTEAIRWSRAAAEQGDAKAQCALGISYSLGLGVPQDDAEAARWYRKAADQGDAYAQYALGYIYREGSGAARDDAQAVRWLRKAAVKGDARARSSLGFSEIGWRMQYVLPMMVLLGGLWFLIDFLLPGRTWRDWRQKAKTLFGMAAMLWLEPGSYSLLLRLAQYRTSLSRTNR
jgi:TPR repeat protein